MLGYQATDINDRYTCDPYNKLINIPLANLQIKIN